jgi:hypothetical protein
MIGLFLHMHRSEKHLLKNINFLTLQENSQLVAARSPRKLPKAVAIKGFSGGQLAATGREENVRW